MPRKKLLSDAEVLSDARKLHAAGGEKAMTFGNLARATGLAASTLAQRFTTVEGLTAAAACAGWQVLMDEAEQADTDAADKGPQGYLKALEQAVTMVPQLLILGARDATALQQADGWRVRVETALALRLGQGEKARAAAQVIFAAWQGQILWGGAEIRIKDLARKLI